MLNANADTHRDQCRARAGSYACLRGDEHGAGYCWGDSTTPMINDGNPNYGVVTSL